MKSRGLKAREYFFFLLMFAFAAAIVGDNAAEALVLSRYDAVTVSRLFAVNALVLFILSLFSMAVVDKYNRAKLAFGFIAFFIMIVGFSWVLAVLGVTGVYLFIYTIAYTGKILLFFFVWTLANDVADSRSGAEDFPLIAAGGTLGAIITTFLIPNILSFIDPMALLLVWIVPLIVCLILVFQVHKHLGDFFKRRRFGRRVSFHPKELLHNLSILQREPVLRNMSTAYYLLFVLIFVQQFHFYEAVRLRFQSAREISQFLGYFYGASMMSTLLLQVTVAGKVTRTWGIIQTLFVQPAILGVAFFALAVTYQIQMSSLFYFQVVVAGVGLRIAFMDSFFSPNYQNFFSTLPNSIRGQSKLVMEGVMKPLAMISATIWIALVPRSGWNSMVMFAIALLAGIVLFQMKESFASTLIHYLAGYHTTSKQHLKKEAELFKGSEGNEVLDEVFREGTLEIQIFVVELLGELRTDDAINRLIDWYEKTDLDPLKRHILHTLATTGKSSLSPFLYKQILNNNPYLAAAALRTIDTLQIVEPRRIAPSLRDAHPKVRAEALVVLAHKGTLSPEKINVTVATMIEDKDVEVQGCGLSALARLHPTQELLEIIKVYWYGSMITLIKHGPLLKYYLRVVKQFADQDLLCELLDCVGIITERNRDMLIELLQDLATSSSSQELLLLKPHVGPLGYAAIIEALGRVDTLLSRDQTRQIQAESMKELSCYQQAKDAVLVLRNQDDEKLQFLADALEREECVLHAQKCLWYAALMDKTGRVSRIVDQAKSQQRGVHAQILEVIDAVGDTTIRTIFRVIFNEETYRPESVGLLSLNRILIKYENSDIPIVRQCTEFVQSKGGLYESK